MGSCDVEEENQLKILITDFRNEWSNACAQYLGAYLRQPFVSTRVGAITDFLKGMKGTGEMRSRLDSKLATIDKLDWVDCGSLGAPTSIPSFSLVGIDQMGAKWTSIYKFIRHRKEDSLKTGWDS
jgi:hypothetical protein